MLWEVVGGGDKVCLHVARGVVMDGGRGGCGQWYLQGLRVQFEADVKNPVVN